MDNSVKMCVDARLSMFGQYYAVPDNMTEEVDAFCRELTRLGEECPDAATFEAAFASRGFGERFNGLLAKCTPKPYQMNAQEQAYAQNAAREIFEEDKERIKKEFKEELVDTAKVQLDSDMNSVKRGVLTATGTMDEYTKISNITEDIGILGKGLKKLFGKKK